MLDHRVFVRVHGWEVGPVVDPLDAGDELLARHKPVGLEVVSEVVAMRERVRLDTDVIGHSPEVELLAIHALKHRVERPDRAEPRVVGEDDLVELADRIADVVKTVLVSPDVESGIVTLDHLVSHGLEDLATFRRQRAVGDDEDPVAEPSKIFQRIGDIILDLTTPVVHDVDQQTAAAVGEASGVPRREGREFGGSHSEPSPVVV